MLGMNRVILSRKGFDSSNGGNCSLFDPDTGKYIVLPIPENEKDREISNPLKYKEIKIINNYFEGYYASNLKELMEATYRWQPKIKRNKSCEESEYAHFDPWLGQCPWLTEDSNHHIGAFGQVGGPQGVLKNHDVGKGSLFLFFSRFKPINWTMVSNFDDIDINPKHLKEGLYFIYGWLKVGKIIEKFADIHSKLNETEAASQSRL